MKQEYLELLQLTKTCLEQHYSQGDKFEAALKWRLQPPKQAEPQPEAPKTHYAPPSRPQPIPRAEPKPPPAPPPQETFSSKSIKLTKPVQKELQGCEEMLSLLKEHLPRLQLLEPPQDFIDLYFITGPEEEPLFAKIVAALEKCGVAARCLPIAQWDEKALQITAKTIVITKTLLATSVKLHPFASRDEERRLFLNGIPILLAPPPSELIAEEQKRLFWKTLLQAAKR